MVKGQKFQGIPGYCSNRQQARLVPSASGAVHDCFFACVSFMSFSLYVTIMYTILLSSIFEPFPVGCYTQMRWVDDIV